MISKTFYGIIEAAFFRRIPKTAQLGWVYGQRPHRERTSGRPSGSICLDGWHPLCRRGLGPI